jgi:hypothetical protein
VSVTYTRRVMASTRRVMASVTSRSFRLPESVAEMGDVWFNLWSRKLWPYGELQVGEELWWYESPTARLRWRTEVVEVEAFPYRSLDAALDQLDSAFGVIVDRGQDYLVGKPNEGFCLAYRVQALKQVDIPKPNDLRFNQSGWERAESDAIARWLQQAR